MTFAAIMLVATTLGGIGFSIHFAWRGIVQGICRRQMVVRGVTYTCEMAKKWGIISILYSLLYLGLVLFSFRWVLDQLRSVR